MNIHLYCFRPEGHGPYSFFVASQSEQLARTAVDDLIQRNGYDTESTVGEAGGWPDSYSLEICEIGEVAMNDNE